MTNLQLRQQKIQEKRKNTSWREFVRDICSRSSVNFYKNNNLVSVYPDVDRIYVVNSVEYQDRRDSFVATVVTTPSLSDNFMQQIQNLLLEVWLPPTSSFFHNENCDYVNPAINSKNSYLSFGIVWCENILYGYSVKDNSDNVVDSVMVRDNCSIIYGSVGVFRSYKIFHSKNIFDSNNIYASANLQWCSYCLFCDNLTNQSYHVHNKSVSPDEFAHYKAIYLETAHVDITVLITNIWTLHSSDNCHLVSHSENVENGIFCYQLHNARNVGMAWSGNGNEELYDTCFFWSPSGNRIYGLCAGGMWIEDCYCSHLINGGFMIFYSIYLENCSYCLWCVGLRNQSYCILNKQYTKEERYEKVDEIFWQMERDSTLWQFFPASMNPFYFNDTAAYLIDPSFTKEEVTKLWYLRRDEPIKVDIPEGAITIQSEDLQAYEWRSVDENWQKTWKLDETVCKRVILDENGDAYRIIPMELEFLQRYSLPLPRKHRLTRMKENFKIN
jgi:hypothetical protein